jgi:hypothetical protein
METESQTGDDDGEPIVTIARYDQAAPAHIDRARLEAGGIPAIVANENQPGLLPFHAVVGGSVELQVFQRDVAAALETLNVDLSAETQRDPDADPDAPTPARETACPSCGSSRVDFVRRRGLWLLVPLVATLVFVSITVAFCSLLGLLLVIGLNEYRPRRMRCDECGRAFELLDRLPGAPGSRVRRGERPTYL